MNDNENKSESLVKDNHENNVIEKNMYQESSRSSLSAVIFTVIIFVAMWLLSKFIG